MTTIIRTLFAFIIGFAVVSGGQSGHIRYEIPEPPEPARIVTVTEPDPGSPTVKPATECLTAHIVWDNGSPLIASIDSDYQLDTADRIRVAMVGPNLWVDVAHDGAYLGFAEDNPNLTSVPIEDGADRVEVCR